MYPFCGLVTARSKDLPALADGREVLESNSRLLLDVEAAFIAADCNVGTGTGICRARQLGVNDELLFRSRQAPVSMRLRAGQASAQLALLSRLGATGGATNRQGCFSLGFHNHRMHCCPARRCSIVTNLVFLRPPDATCHEKVAFL